jgi:hypothetical protein
MHAITGQAATKASTKPAALTQLCNVRNVFPVQSNEPRPRGAPGAELEGIHGHALGAGPLIGVEGCGVSPLPVHSDAASVGVRRVPPCTAEMAGRPGPRTEEGMGGSATALQAGPHPHWHSSTHWGDAVDTIPQLAPTTPQGWAHLSWEPFKD